jgi:hypothetical protein
MGLQDVRVVKRMGIYTNETASEDVFLALWWYKCHGKGLAGFFRHFMDGHNGPALSDHSAMISPVDCNKA